jgi:butyrate kinase
MLAWKFAEEFGKSAFTLNATTVDELNDYARLTGIKGVYRFAHTHCLNQKAVAQFHAEKIGRRYEDCNFIVAHIDGGITVAAHEHGRTVDSNMGADGDGAFSPTRIGSLPVLTVLNYLETHSTEELRRRCTRSGGFVDFFGTSNADTVHERIEKGDRAATLVWNTMIYQICKLIGEMAVVLCGKVDGILLTGGLIRFADIVEGIEKHCGFIAPVFAYPGEMEQEALALPTLKVLRGELTAQTYTGRDVWGGFGDIGL